MTQITLVSARVPAGLVTEFKARAAADERTVSSALRVAMKRYITSEAPDATNIEGFEITAGQGRHDGS